MLENMFPNLALCNVERAACIMSNIEDQLLHYGYPKAIWTVGSTEDSALLTFILHGGISEASPAPSQGTGMQYIWFPGE